MAKWFYYNESGEKIEVTGGQLKGLAKAGMITPDTLVETEEGKTAPARKIKGLSFTEAAALEANLVDEEKNEINSVDDVFSTFENSPVIASTTWGANGFNAKSDAHKEKSARLDCFDHLERAGKLCDAVFVVLLTMGFLCGIGFFILLVIALNTENEYLAGVAIPLLIVNAVNLFLIWVFFCVLKAACLWMIHTGAVLDSVKIDKQ